MDPAILPPSSLQLYINIPLFFVAFLYLFLLQQPAVVLWGLGEGKHNKNTTTLSFGTIFCNDVLPRVIIKLIIKLSKY